MIRRKKLYIFIAFLTLILLFTGLFFQISKSRTFQFFGNITSRVKTEKNIVALTFDDAPSEYSDNVLEILKTYNIKSTFYVIGQDIEKFPEQARSIVAQGHELGNHSYSHRRLVLKSQAFIENEIKKTNELIYNAGYRGLVTFRPPNGKKLFGLPWYLKNNNLETVMWDVEPDTYVSGDVKKIIDYTLNNVRPGSIILLHPFCASSCVADREALPQIISGLKSRGFDFVTISELLKNRTD